MGTGLYIGEEAIGMVRAGTFLEGGGIDTSDATATSSDILNGKTAYAKGSKVTGTIQSQAAQTITPGTADQIIAAGKYLSGTQTIKGDANLVSDNIISGKSIFGVAGSHTCSTPSGTIDITTNGTHDVTDYASANVNVPSTGIDTSDATAAANDIIKDKTAYVNGEKIVGTLEVASRYVKAAGTFSVDSDASSFKFDSGLDSVDGVLVWASTINKGSTYSWTFDGINNNYITKEASLGLVAYNAGSKVTIADGLVTIKQGSSSNPIKSGEYNWVAYGYSINGKLDSITKVTKTVEITSSVETIDIQTDMATVEYVSVCQDGSIPTDEMHTYSWIGGDINKMHRCIGGHGAILDITSGSDLTSINGGTVTVSSEGSDYPIIAGTYSVVAWGTGGSGGTTPNLQEKSATPTTSVQTITPDSGYDGLSQVTVNAIPSNYIEPTGNKEITANGTGIDVAAYATVSVNVPSEEVSLQEKSVTPSTSTQTITPDSGYDGLSQVTVAAIPTATQATPSITVSTSGLITAKSTQSSGYVESGTKSATKQLTTKAATTYTPGTANQTISSGTYLTGVQTISGDSNLVAANIKSGVSIFGVAGSYSGSGGAGGSTGGLVMKTGTTTSATIDTGLSSISFITIYKDSLTATGLIQGVYSTDEGTLHYTYCSSYSGYFKMCTVGTSTASSVSGGTFTLGTSGTSGLSSSTTYNWIAFGAE